LLICIIYAFETEQYGRRGVELEDIEIRI